jgi:zinc transport system substrate-binding protein
VAPLARLLSSVTLASVTLLAPLGACAPSEAGRGPSGPHVVTTLYPLEFVAREVAGRHAAIDDIVPAGADPHDLELTPRQVVDISAADLVVYVGGGFQPAVERAVDEAGVAALDVLGAAASAPGAEGGDPHVWLDPVATAAVARAVEGRLAALEPTHAGAYRRNASSLRSDLDRLHDDLATGLAGCAGATLVTAHEAFGHLAGRYGLDEVGIAGPDPESEPSPQRVAEIVDLVRAEGVAVVFAERGAPAGLVEAVAEEGGATTAVLDPLESEPPGGYLAGMRANLRALSAGLGCG